MDICVYAYSPSHPWLPLCYITHTPTHACILYRRIYNNTFVCDMYSFEHASWLKQWVFILYMNIRIYTAMATKQNRWRSKLQFSFYCSLSSFSGVGVFVVVSPSANTHLYYIYIIIILHNAAQHSKRVSNDTYHTHTTTDADTSIASREYLYSIYERRSEHIAYNAIMPYKHDRTQHRCECAIVRNFELKRMPVYVYNHFSPFAPSPDSQRFGYLRLLLCLEECVYIF